MNCPVCGTANEAGAAFCYKCGSALPTTNASAAPATGRTVDLSRDQWTAREHALPSIEESPAGPQLERGPDLPRENPYARPVAEPPSLPLEGNARVYPAPPAMQPYVVASPAVGSQTSNLAMFSLVFGILSWLFLPVIGAIAAVITGHMGRREIRESGGQMTGGGLATAGLILGYLQLALALFAFVFLCLVLGGLTRP